MNANLGNLKTELLNRIGEIERIKGKPQSRDVATVPINWYNQLLKWLKEDQIPPGPIDTSSLLLPNGSINESKIYRVDFQVIELSIWELLIQYFPCEHPIITKITLHPENGETVVILRPLVLKLITPTKLLTKTCGPDWQLKHLKKPLCIFIRVVSDTYHYVSMREAKHIDDTTRIGDYIEVYGDEIKLLPIDDGQSTSNSHSCPQGLNQNSKLLNNSTFRSITTNLYSEHSKPNLLNTTSFQRTEYPPTMNTNPPEPIKKGHRTSFSTQSSQGCSPSFSPTNLNFPQIFQPQKSRSFQFQPAKSTRFPRAIGMPNLGNSCYFNSVFQSIIRIEPFYNFLVCDRFETYINKTNTEGSGGKIAMEFRNFAKQMTETSSAVLNPSNIRSVICAKFPQFNNYNQHDAQEFLGCLLNVLHEDLLELHRVHNNLSVYTPRSQDKADSEPDQQFSPIGDIFFSLMEAKIECPKCGFSNTHKEHLLFFPLSLPDQSQEVSLPSLIKKFQSREVLDSGNTWCCDNCNNHVQAIRESSFIFAPEVLIIHLKRFAVGNYGMIKIETPVSYPNEFSGGLLTSTEYHVYILVSVIFHIGTLNTGHYTAASWDPASKRWFLFNDSKVTEITTDKVHSPDAYLLFYQKLI